jgi:hypothetical protein
MSVEARLPWATVQLTQSAGNIWAATFSVPVTQAAGTYLVRFCGTDRDGELCETNVTLVVTAPADGGDVEFVITD